MDVSVWMLVSVIARWIIYAALAVLIAIPTMIVISTRSHKLSLRTYAIVAAILAGLASVSHFFIQVGSLSESGWLGMTDVIMMDIVWLSGHGTSLLCQWVAIVLLLIVCVLNVGYQYRWLGIALYLLAVISLAISFTSTGHVASLPIWVNIVLSLHVLVALWWIGSLLPLVQACYRLGSGHLYQLMHRFGQIAMVLVGTLCTMGAILTYQLIPSFDQLFTTSYGQTLQLKLVAVGCMLLLAARHKWRQVPVVQHEETAHLALAQSIKLEWFFGVVILLITITLSSTAAPR